MHKHRLTNDSKSLIGISLVEDFSETSLTELESQCSWSSFAADEQIIDYLNTDDCVYFLTAGTAKVVIYSATGRVVAFRTLNQGEMFGELAAIDGQPRTASVEAVQPCTIAKLAASDFCTLLERESSVAKNLCRHLVEQVRSLTARVYEFSTLGVQNRIHADLLRRVCDDDGCHETGYISPAPKHAEIASRISTHREAVSRELSNLRKSGLITRNGTQLVVNDLERLRTMVHEAKAE